jgi:predicted MPP superfamily phosphohydrolase
VEISGQIIRIGGLYDYAFALDAWNSCSPDRMEPEVYQFLTKFQDTDVFKLMLAHRPDSFIFGEASVTWDIDLVVSGHLHGGQVVVPFKGGLIGGDQGWFPKYVHGLYEKDDINIFITSGLGSSRKVLPRFNNPPEIAVLRLLPLE